MLRSKVNFVVLEGFSSELLKEDLRIDSILESETNKDSANDKFNRIDLVIENQKKEIVLIELQYTAEADYFYRILFGASKIITDYMDEGMEYEKVRKIISVNMIYFDLGQGEDYLYHGSTEFKGINKGDILKLTDSQKELYKQGEVSEIYPEYYLIKINQFDDIAKNTVDEWIYFLKNEEIKDTFRAKGLKEAKERLSIMKLTEEERFDYLRYKEQLRFEKSLMLSNYKEGKVEGIREGKAEGMREGKAEGIREGKIDLLFNLLKAKFGSVISEAIRQRIVDAEIDEIEQWSTATLDAESIDEVFS